MSLDVYIRQVQEQLMAKPTSTIRSEMELYKSLLSKGVQDEVYQTCLEQEMSRRQQLWESVEL